MVANNILLGSVCSLLNVQVAQRDLGDSFQVDNHVSSQWYLQPRLYRRVFGIWGEAPGHSVSIGQTIMSIHTELQNEEFVRPCVEGFLTAGRSHLREVVLQV